MAISPSELNKLKQDIQNGTQHSFYTSAAWYKVRREVMRLDHYECVRCKSKGNVYTGRLIVHHINHLEDRPDLALSIYDENGKRNLECLCQKCHMAEHPEQSPRYKPRKKPITVERWD